MKRTIAVAMLLLAAFAGAFAVGGKEGAGGVNFIMNNGTEPQTLDPSKISGVPEHRIYMALFEGLVINDPKTSKALPGLAESWKVSADGTVITFKLRKSTWTDGTPITDKTVVDSWHRMLAPETGAVYAYMMTMVGKGAAEYNEGKAGTEAVAIKAIEDYTF
mgnify:CR=1 FL=1